MAESPRPTSDGSVQLHKYITKHSEYFIQGDTCVAVVSRQAGSIQGGRKEAKHQAIEQRLRALVRWSVDGNPSVLVGRAPKVGDCLLLGSDGAEVMTSAIRRVETVSSSVRPLPGL